MEADLARYYLIDYRDRWRTDEHGRRLLTLRMIWVRVRYLPTDAAVSHVLNDGHPFWTRDQRLLDDLRIVLELVGGNKNPKPDPDRKVAVDKPPTPQRVRSLTRARARAARRRRDIEAGLIT